jgi:hypothetical protein
MKMVSLRRFHGACRAIGFTFAALALVANSNAAKAPPPKVATLPPHEGEKFIPTDVDTAHPIYETSFEGADALKDWRLEGGKRMSVVDGSLVLESDASEGERSKNHLVCWLDREVPGDFLLEFTVRPAQRDQGLNIVFFCTRGLQGEPIFDPSLKPRAGQYPQYHSSDLNGYHISYWKGGGAEPNLRKSKGFHLVAQGNNLVYGAPKDAFQTIRVYKRDGRIRLMVDDVVALAWDDDGRAFGPVLHSGWAGLRQMGHTGRCEYGHFKVYPLKP